MIIGEKKVLLGYLIDSLNTAPESWRWHNEKGNYIVHSSGLSLWVCFEIHVYQPNEIKFGWWERRGLQRAFNKWKTSWGNAEALATERSNCIRATALLRGDKALRRAA